MTLQVGLVGADGIVLASDQCMIEFVKVYSKTMTSKIINIAAHKIAYSFSGDTCAVYVGIELEEALNQNRFDFTDIRTSLRRLGDTVFKRESERLKSFVKDVNRKLIVVFYGLPKIEVWELCIEEHSRTQPIYTYLTAGDRGNTARFFTNYFRKGQTVEILKRLAAHVILSGHKDNPMSVDGLEMAVINSEFTPCSTGEIERLTHESALLDAEITKHFIAASQTHP